MKGRLLTTTAVLAVATLGLFRPWAGVASADSGTISLTNTSLSYTHGPFVIPNPSDQAGAPVCGAPQVCDDYTLTVNVPAGTDATDQLLIQFSWPSTVPSTDFDLWVYDSNGNVIGSNVSGTDPEPLVIPAVSGTYTIRADPFTPNGQSYTGSVQLQPIPTSGGGGGAPADTAPAASGIYPRFQNYAIPHTLGGTQEGEPSIGYDPNSGNVLYQAGLQTFRVGFDDSTSPAAATWQEATASNTNKISLDPILFTDPRTGRTFASQLTGQDSATAFSDNDGTSWTPSQGGGIPSGVDHQTIGGGPYSVNATVTPPNTGSVTGYKDAVYYCSQDIATAFCARSDNGGLTFGAGVPIYNVSQCGGIHGHVKVAPDGTVYVPNRSCNGQTGLAVSTDDGVTWTLRTIPGSTASQGGVDPSIGIASDGTVYDTWQGSDAHEYVAVSHDRGQTWSSPLDVAAQVGVQNSAFPEAVAGDPNRAAIAFLGTTTPGNYQGFGTFNGAWYLYISTTYDGGKTWATVNATPNDPVQRGSICNGGTGCGNTPNDRNLLDFMDMTIDSTGRVMVAYPDGCVDACVTADPTKRADIPGDQADSTNSFTAYATIARQSGGRALLSAFDKQEPAIPARPSLTATTTKGSSTATLSWQAPDNGGSPITGYNVYSGTTPSSLSLVASTDKTFAQLAITPGQTAYYQVQAINAIGSGPLSPVATLQVITQNVQCTLPGNAAAIDQLGDETGYPYNQDLDLTEVDVAEPGNLFGWNNMAFTIHVSNLGSALPGHAWRVFWENPQGTGRFYVGADWNGTAMSYNYGTIMDGLPEGAPSAVTANYPAIAGYYSNSANEIVVVVPKSFFPNMQTGQQLPQLQARTFVAQADVTVFGRAAAADIADGQYYLQGSSACPQ